MLWAAKVNRHFNIHINHAFPSHWNQPSCLPLSTFPRISKFFSWLPKLVENCLESTWNEHPRTVASGRNDWRWELLPPAHSDINLILLCGQSSPLPLVLHKYPWVTQDSLPKGTNSIASSLQKTQSLLPFAAHSTVGNQLKWQCFLAITKLAHHQKSLPGRHVSWNPLATWTDSVVVSSLELFQVIREASDGRPTTKNPLFQSSQFPILFLTFGDSNAVIKYKENGFINSSLTLCEKTWIRKPGKTCLGLVLSSKWACGWNPFWESRIHGFWQYRVILEKVNLFQLLSLPTLEAPLLRTICS